MKYLFNSIDAIAVDISNADRILLLLDYDGTLTPIVPNPEDAVLSGGTRGILKKLSEIPEVAVVVISGRSLKQLEDLLGVSGITLAGNHGYEVRLPSGIEIRHYNDEDISTAREVRDFLMAQSKTIHGVLVEDKGPVIALHWRKAAAESIRQVESLILSLRREFAGRIRFGRGKKVFETRPLGQRNKGVIAHEMITALSGTGNVCVFFFGDDDTDEDAFKELKGNAWTVFVGKRDAVSSAEFYLESPAQVVNFLKHILEIVEKRGIS